MGQERRRILLRGRIAPRGARPSTGPEKRSAPRAGPRLGGLSRPPRAAASAESEGPSSPLTRRERACVGVGRCLTAPDCALYSFWWGGRRRASLPETCHLSPGRKGLSTEHPIIPRSRQMSTETKELVIGP